MILSITQIGNERFAWFGSTGSKSRINFLELLHAGSLQYQFGDEARAYLQEQGLSVAVRQALRSQPPVDIATREKWAAHYDQPGSQWRVSRVIYSGTAVVVT